MFKFLHRADAVADHGNADSRPNQNTYWVLKGRFLAGEYPGDGASPVGHAKLHAFRGVGINTFIDLTRPREMMPYADFIASPEVECLRFPIPAFGLPDSQQMHAVLDALDATLAAGRKVYLHCQGGAGRTGMVVACWLQRQGRSPGGALRELSGLWSTTSLCQRGKRSPSTNAQVDWVRRWPKAARSLQTVA